MLLELMSNGKLAELPSENVPENSVMLLLPHNKYLLGTFNSDEKWIVLDKNKNETEDVFLYNDESLPIINEGTPPTVIPSETVNALRKELFSHSEPPGRHVATILMMRTFMKDNAILDGNEIPDEADEKSFYNAMKHDEVLYKIYWTLRFALSRNELETVRRLKAWLAADPKTFQNPKHIMKIWFTLLELPDESVIKELEELSFSKLEIQRMSEHNLSPLILYNPISGWLILARFGKVSTMFLSWIYLSHDLYYELKNIKKMSLSDIIHAVWGEHEIQQAMEERSKYKGAE